MCDIVDLEEALKKTGPELFKELYRIYPVADPDDYFKNGMWKNDLLKADLVLMEAHRREAGAPDCPDIDDIKFPSLPVQTAIPTLGGHSLLGGTTSLVSAGQSGTVGAGVGGQVVEIRLIALFVAKWKLDPVTAKASLSTLTPGRRRYVIQHFKTTTSGMEATEELKTFIGECEKDGKWDTASTPAPTSGIVGLSNGTTPAPGTLANQAAKVGGIRPAITPKITPATTITPKIVSTATTPRPALVTARPPSTGGTSITPVSGLKRPGGTTVSPPAWASNKRPTLTTSTPATVKPAITPPKVGATPPKIGAQLPKAAAGKGGPSTIRPPVRPAGGKLISGLLSNF